jgi:hypothetical protein
LLLSFKEGSNFAKGACNSIFGSAAAHPFWPVVFDILLNRSATKVGSHKDVLFSTGPAVLREAVRRLLRLRPVDSITGAKLAELRSRLGIRILDASVLHPVTADRRSEDDEARRPANAVCTHHFVSSWVRHDKARHADTERRRRRGDAAAAVDGEGQPVVLD